MNLDLARQDRQGILIRQCQYEVQLLIGELHIWLALRLLALPFTSQVRLGTEHLADLFEGGAPLRLTWQQLDLVLVGLHC
eukprot:CAMPEP_0184303906 /NCGR_PEP_ID=MMETSP1049-20130417/13565_1 /TAXON_ID=77928 /ORGANISM="Proteomonas sulcata, Strain CCMP704" /LENGTH=79 /DNA_ID=CAMNT_0026615599 /DNA_START=149 /DNA_END=388 /DNA_ORIENTATION=+